jgi:UDP-N-acetylglucosamine 3-dehydrogenase
MCSWHFRGSSPIHAHRPRPLPDVIPSPTGRRYDVALLGLGLMGRRHARVLASLADRFRLVGAYDPRVGVEAPPGVPLLATEADAIALAELVVVATPIDAHAPAVARALVGGRHVLVEKPLCARADEAHSLALHARQDARLFVGHSERYNPVVRALARLLRRDPAHAIELTRVGPTSATAPGVLLNLGVHDFDLAAYLGQGEVFLRPAQPALGARASRDDVAHVLFESSHGVTGSLYVDRTVAAKRRTVRVATARWIYEGDLVGHRLTRAARATGRVSEVPLAREEPLLAQAVALADALDAVTSSTPRTARTLPSSRIADGFDGARAVALAERAAGWSDAASGDADEAEKLSLLGSP